MIKQEDLPDVLKPFLGKARDQKNYEIKDIAEWFERPLVCKGRLRIIAGAQQEYNTRCLGIRRSGTGGTSLVVEEFIPDPPAGFYKTKPAIIFRTAYVESGYVVMTSFHARALRQLAYENRPGVEIDEFNYGKVELTQYFLELVPPNDVQLGLDTPGGRLLEKPFEVSFDVIRFCSGKLENTGEGDFEPENASLTLLRGEPALPLKVDVETLSIEKYEARITEIDPQSRDRLIRYIDGSWLKKAETLRKREIEAKQRKEEDLKGSYLKTLQKKHICLLSGDESWESKLGRYGVIRRIEDVDLGYVLEELNNNRTDIVVVDDEIWGEHSTDLCKALQSDKRLRKTPTFWLADSRSRFSINRLEKIIKLGVYDLLDRRMDEAELIRRFDWAMEAQELGNGEAMVIVSPDPRRQYRLGIALQRENIRIVKCTTLNNPLVKMNEHKPCCVIVDSLGIGRGYDTILSACLGWAEKSPNNHNVILLTRHIESGDVVRWLEAGLDDIISSDLDMENLAARVYSKIGDRAAALNGSDRVN